MSTFNKIDPSKIDKEINLLKFPKDPKTYEYKSTEFEYVDIIESGRHIVKEFCYKPLNIRMAVKTIRIPQNRYQDHEKDDKLERLKKELTNFRTLSCHPNIVDFYGLCFNDGEALICMELMDMSLYDLYLVVHDRQEKFPEKILGYVAVQVLEALGFCKSKKFIHRDVKPKNILLNTKGEVKLCDFGESRILKDSLASTFVGTIAYWPPERFETTKPIKGTIPQKQEQNALIDEDVFRYDVRSDIWSLGITLAETAYGKLPFVDDNGEPISRDNNRQENIVTIQHCILSTKTDELIQRCFGDNYSGDFIEFVNMCLEKLDKRPKFDGLMKTKFYQKFRENVKQEDMAAFIGNYEEDDASESNQIEPPEIDKEINLLKFPKDPKIYKYNPTEFEFVDIIESSRHIVKKFCYKPLNIKMAVKTIRISRYQDHENDDKLVRLKKELTNFRTLSCHPNIVDFYGLCFHKNQDLSSDWEVLICMELMDMSLYDLYLTVHDRQKNFPEDILGYVAVQVLEALGFCKSKNFIHRDVKPKNILLNTKGEVKLCDFGEARILKDSLASTFVGTIAYWPPERFETNKPVKGTIPQEQNALIDEDVSRYDVRSDIWSLGITLAETAYGKLPFVNDDGKEISRDNNKENIVTIQHCILSTKTDELILRCFGDNYSGDFIEFVNMCLEKLDKRPKFDVLMKTKFYNKFRENVKQEDMAAFIKNYDEDDASESNPEATQESKHDKNF